MFALRPAAAPVALRAPCAAAGRRNPGDHLSGSHSAPSAWGPLHLAARVRVVGVGDDGAAQGVGGADHAAGFIGVLTLNET